MAVLDAQSTTNIECFAPDRYIVFVIIVTVVAVALVAMGREWEWLARHSNAEEMGRPDRLEM